MTPIDRKAKKSPKLSAQMTSKPVSDLIVAPRGRRLPLTPLGDCIFVGDPDAGRDEPGMIGGIHLPPGQAQAIGYALLTVEAVGADVKGINKGDDVLIARVQVEKIVHDGNAYHRTRTAAVIGVIPGGLVAHPS